MGLSTVDVVGVKITTSSKIEILEEVQKYLVKIKSQSARWRTKVVKPLVIFTPNPEIITYAQEDNNFMQIVNSAQINIPDGMGVCWVIKKKTGKNVRRISGVDFMLDLCNLAQEYGFTIGLIGGRAGVALKTLECLQRSYNNLSGWAMDGPEIEIQNSILRLRSGQEFIIKQESDKDTSEVTRRVYPGRDSSDFVPTKSVLRPTQSDGGGIENMLKTPGRRQKNSFQVEESKDRYFSLLVNEIGNRQTDILFVGLGFPKQEYFIDKLRQYIEEISYRGTPNFDNLPKSSYSRNLFNHGLIMMAVGGSLDYISGRVPRAPEWMRRKGFEWLFRLVNEPWRLVRQLRGGEFFLKVILEK